MSRFAESAGYKVEIEQKEDVFLVIIRGNSGTEVFTNQESFETDKCIADSSLKAQTIFLIKSSTLGQGSKELGEVLLRSFIYTLKDSSSLPAKLLFMNSGVYLQETLSRDQGVDDIWIDILCDPQTSGGLLLSVSPDKSQEAIKLLQENDNTCAALIGEIVSDNAGKIILKSHLRSL